MTQMGKKWPQPRVVALILWGLAGAGFWLTVNNRFVLHWASSLTKTVTISVFALALYGVAQVASRRDNRMVRFAVPGMILSVFALGEIHRAWLRRACGGHSSLTTQRQTADWLHPVTTTNLVITKRTLQVHQSIGRLRVAQLTDLHLTPALPWSFYESVVKRLNAEQPDMVVLTGDYLSKAANLPLLERWSQLPIHARMGTFAVLGNHDYWAGTPNEVRRILSAAGVTMLSGKCQRLASAQHVVLCGTEWPWGEDFDTTNTEADDFVIALSHTPDNIYALRGRADAVFSGHYHGGQWRIPGIGALIVPSIYGRRFDGGNFSVDGTELFVSSGVGADFPPVRLFCAPEILLVDFVAQTSKLEPNNRMEASRIQKERGGPSSPALMSNPSAG